MCTVHCSALSIAWFKEDQAFLRSYDSAPRLSSRVWSLDHPLPSASCLSFSVFLCVAGRAYWRERRVGGGDGAKSCDGEKAWSSINHSILSGWMFIYVQFVYENVSSALPLGPVDVLWESAQHNCHKQHNYVCLYVQYINMSTVNVRKVNISSVVDPDRGKIFRIRSA